MLYKWFVFAGKAYVQTKWVVATRIILHVWYLEVVDRGSETQLQSDWKYQFNSFQSSTIVGPTNSWPHGSGMEYSSG